MFSHETKKKHFFQNFGYYSSKMNMRYLNLKGSHVVNIKWLVEKLPENYLIEKWVNFKINYQKILYNCCKFVT